MTELHQDILGQIKTSADVITQHSFHKPCQLYKFLMLLYLYLSK